MAITIDPPVPMKADTYFTVEQFLALPDEGFPYELVGGELVEKPMSATSTEVEALIAAALIAINRRSGKVKVYTSSLTYKCFQGAPSKLRRPDVSVILKERFDAIGDPSPGVMPIVPDLAVEVISENDLYLDVMAKVDEYLAAGFPRVWIVDAVSMRIQVFTANERPIILQADDRVTLDILPDFNPTVRELVSTQ